MAEKFTFTIFKEEKPGAKEPFKRLDRGDIDKITELARKAEFKIHATQRHGTAFVLVVEGEEKERLKFVGLVTENGYGTSPGTPSK